MNAADLAAIATGRKTSMFAPDLFARHGEISRALDGARVLVIGGAGSIGAATAALLAPHRTRALHVIDINENALVELVRQLRGAQDALGTQELELLPLDFGGALMRRFLDEQAPYDLVLNFAAVKHVRTEKDTCSSLHMVDTNIVKQARLLRALSMRQPVASYFSVSTDKAANPVNLMGASKRVMEQIMFSSAIEPASGRRATSARFANVAFSDGSLLQGWLHRLAKGQPLAVPKDTERFFISLQEAGEVCVLAALCAPAHHVVVPRPTPALALRDLQTVAIEFLNANGYEAVTTIDPAEAIREAAPLAARRKYPLLLTPLDTVGEKTFEEFVADGESTVECGLEALLAIPFTGVANDWLLTDIVMRLENAIQDASVSLDKNDIASLIGELVPEFRHILSEKRLDDRL